MTPSLSSDLTRPPILLVDRAQCARSEEEVEAIHRFFRNRRKRLEAETILKDQQKQALADLSKRRSKTDFEKIPHFVKGQFVQLYRKDISLEDTISELEHRNRLVVLMTDGIPDPKGELPRLDRMHQDQIAQLYEEMKHTIGWLSFGMASVSQMNLKDLTGMEMPQEGMLESDVLFVVGSELFCGEKIDKATTKLEEISAQMHRLWQRASPQALMVYGPTCPENEIIGASPLQYLKKIRKKSRHLSINATDVDSYWQESDPNLILKIKVGSKYQFSQDFSNNEFAIHITGLEGRKSTIIPQEQRNLIIHGEEKDIEVPINIDTEKLDRTPSLIEVGLRTPESTCQRLHFELPEGPIRIPVPPRREVRVLINEGQKDIPTLSSIARVPVKVENPFSSCLIMKRRIIQMSNETKKAERTPLVPLCISAGNPEKGIPYQESNDLEMRLKQLKITNLDFEWEVIPTRKCKCEGNEEELTPGVRALGRGTAPLRVIYVSSIPYYVSFVCSIIGILPVSILCWNRIRVRSPRYYQRLYNSALFLLALALFLRFFAFDFLHGVWDAFGKSPGYLLVGAMFALLLKMFPSRNILHLGKIMGYRWNWLIDHLEKLWERHA